MPKKLADKWDDTVRPGKQLGYEQQVGEGNPWGVFIRVFNSSRMMLSPWVIHGLLTTDREKALVMWDDVVSATKSGAVMCAALVRVKDVYEPGKISISPDKWWCNGVCIDCRASHLLRDGKQGGKDQVPDGYDLGEALRREFHLWVMSEDQSGDDAAKDKGHDTASRSPEPTPENTAVDEKGETIQVVPLNGSIADPIMTGAQHMANDEVETVNDGGLKHTRKRSKKHS